MKKAPIFCKICNMQTKLVVDSFSRYHLNIYHNINMKQYYDMFIKSENSGKCIVCGADTKFDGYNKGYRRTCSIQCQHKDPNVIIAHKIAVNNYNKDHAINKRKKTCKEKYGVSFISQSSEIKKKVKTTCLNKYGQETTLQLEQVKNNRIKSLKENKERINKKRKNSWTLDIIDIANKKREKTINSIYGVSHIGASREIKEKRKITCLKEYNCEHIFGSVYLRCLMELNKKWCPVEKYDEYKKYKMEINKLTYKNVKKLYSKWDGKCYYTGILLNNISYDKFQKTIDHKTSISYGFLNNISAEEIGNIDNLCICSRLINTVKSGMTESQFLNSELYKKYKQNICFLNEFQIETDEGFVDFSGIKKVKEEYITKITLEDGNFIECTEDHLLFINETSTIKCCDTVENKTILLTKFGYKKIIHIEKNSKIENVYDVIDVKNKNHSFYANDILVHNCLFQGSAITLIDGNFITEKLKWEEPIARPNDYTQVWKYPEEGRIYLASVDTAGGVGSDSSIINLFDITDYPSGGAIEQVAIYKNNLITPIQFAELVFDTCKEWNNAYVVGELNGLSAQVIDRLFNDFEYENIYYDYEDDTYGLTADKVSKPKAAVWFKEELENGRIILKDSGTIDELGYFEEVKPGVYKAKIGRNNHDDCVMTCLWATYFLKSPFFEDEKDTWSKNSDPDEDYAENPEAEEALAIFLENDKETYGEDWLENEEMSRYKRNGN